MAHEFVTMDQGHCCCLPQLAAVGQQHELLIKQHATQGAEMQKVSHNLEATQDSLDSSQREVVQLEVELSEVCHLSWAKTHVGVFQQ